jgi:hypothetical protein
MGVILIFSSFLSVEFRVKGGKSFSQALLVNIVSGSCQLAFLSVVFKIREMQIDQKIAIYISLAYRCNKKYFSENPLQTVTNSLR